MGRTKAEALANFWAHHWLEQTDIEVYELAKAGAIRLDE
jgi:hypothetical protein